MSQEEARLLLDAWNYFDSHPKARFWEGLPGISRDEFLRLMPVVTGLESLVEAKIYLGQVAAGKLYETVPGTIIEKAQEENLPASSVEDARRATTAVRAWLKNIKPKSAEDVAFRQVAVAQVKAELARIEEKATPPIPGKAATPSVPEKTAAPAPAVPEPEPLSVGIKITPAASQTLQKFTAKVATLPFRTAVAWSRPTLSASEPQRAAALTLLTRGISSEKIEEAAGLGVNERGILIRAIKNEEGIFSVQAQLLRRAFPGKISFLLEPELGLTQAEVSVFFSPTEKGGFSAAPRRSFFGDIFNRFGQQLFGKVATNFIKGVGQKAIAGVGAKAAAEAAITGVAAAAGPQGLLVRAAAYLATEFGPKVLGWIKEHAGKIFGALLVGGGLLLGGGAGLGMALGGGLLLVGGAGLRAAAGNVGNFFSFLFTGILLPSIGIPILVALISIPVLVAIILFIINSGAYLVPPSDIVVSASPYIKVEKIPKPEGPFKNDDLQRGITVEYTITIYAKKGSLENIEIEYSCEVIKKEGQTDCPDVSSLIPKPEDENYPKIISPVEPYSFSYPVTYNSPRFRDSAIIDTITVTADAPEEKGAKESGSAAIIIGEPPTACFVFDGSWPGNFRANELATIAELSRAKVYMSKLCSKGEILLRFGGNNGSVGGDVFAGPNIITIYSAGVQYGRTSTLYTLAHETGHIFARRFGDIFARYLDTAGVGGIYICTYPFGGSNGESFPESIALYIANSPGHPKINLFSCLGDGNFKTKYPNHWQFARNFIFQENLGW